MKEVIIRSQTEVLEWLQANHPELHRVAEIDRAWIWLPVDLRSQPEVRASIKEFGFRYADGGHPLESGAIGTWAHHCDAPLPYRRKGRRRREGTAENEETNNNNQDWEARARALLSL